MSEELLAAAGLTSRYTLGFIFLAAALAKLSDRKEFEQAVGNYELLPEALVPTAAAWIPRVEFACGLALIFGIAANVAGGLAASLLVVFTVAIVVNLHRGRHIDCGCRGRVAPREIGWSRVLVNVALVAVVLTASYANPSSLSLVTLGETSDGLALHDSIALVTVSAALVLLHGVVGEALRVRASAEELGESFGMFT